MAKLTKRAVDAASTAERELFLWDDELAGFGLRVFPSGIKSYLIQYRHKGRTRRLVIGPHGLLTAEEARTRARRLLVNARDGADPAEEKQEARKAQTVAEFARFYLEEHADRRKKASSARNDRQMIRDYIEPAFGTRKLADIERADVQRLHASLAATPYCANRVLALLSKIMNLAEKWGVRPDGSNPCRHVERFAEKKRRRFLSNEELARLGEALVVAARGNEELPSALAAVRLLLFTGARLSEILTLRWEHVDFERRCLDLPDSKTGAKLIQLNPPAMEVLNGLPRDGSPWVIRGRSPERRLVNLEKPWQRIRERAKLSDVRLHDLRHSFASVGAAMGSSLVVLGALLGHTQPSTTARYAHLYADPLKEAADVIGARIQAMMTPKTGRSDNIVELRQAKG